VALEFRLLGAVESNADGRLLDLGPARQRCVLVALLVDANRPVSVEALLYRIWADRPPQRARHSLYTYLSHLRRALSDVADISRRSGGYVLSVDSDAVDLHRFRRLVALAHDVDDRAAITALEQALALWRGEAAAGLDGPWLEALRGTLDAERLATELDRIDIGLRLGWHARLLGVLASLVATHPLDERFAGQYLLALYRCGRPAEALAHYQQTRRRLADELGIDPGSPLQALHRQILAADPVLDLPASVRVAAAGVPAPAQLPRDVPGFAGRADELAGLDTGLDTPGALLVISGTAGVGKTALAVRWAHRVANRYPDGQLYVNLRGFDPGGPPASPAQALRGFLDAFEVPPAKIPSDVDGKAAMYRSLLSGRRVLVVLDNARDADQVRPLLPGSPGCLVVVTSRDRLTGLLAADAARPLSLALLSTVEARQLIAGRIGTDRVAAEPEAVDEIIHACARLPLALAVAAARAAAEPHRSLAALADQLREAGNTLDALGGGTDPATDLRTVLSLSYRTLDPPAARLFRLLGGHPGPDIGAPAAASLTGLSGDRVRALLSQLTLAHLLVEHPPGRYAFHDLLRGYAVELLSTVDGEGERLAASHRVLDHYVHTSYAAAIAVNPPRDPPALPPFEPGVFPQTFADRGPAQAWFEAEHAVLLAAVDAAVSAGLDRHACHLVWSLYNYLHERGYWDQEVAVHEVAADAADRLDDPHWQAYACRTLAGAYVQVGRFDPAHEYLRRALAAGERLEDPVSLARTHGELGYVFGRQGRYREALDHSWRAHDLSKAAAQPSDEARALNNIGWYEAVLGDYRPAIIHSGQALRYFQAAADIRGQAAAWDTLGLAHHRLGDHGQAIDCYLPALAVYRDLGARLQAADTLSNLGDAYEATGEHDAAQRARQEALRTYRELGLTAPVPDR